MKIVFTILFLAALTLRAEVKWNCVNPTTADVAIRVTDTYGPAEEGYPYYGAVIYRIPPKTTVQFYTSRFSQATFRFNFEPDIPGWAGYETSFTVFNAVDGTHISTNEGNVYKIDPVPSSATFSPFISLALGGVFAYLLFGRFLR